MYNGTYGETNDCDAMIAARRVSCVATMSNNVMTFFLNITDVAIIVDR